MTLPASSEPPHGGLEVVTLGSFAMFLHGRPLDLPRARKAQHLLTLLLSAERHRLRRSDVIEKLWPDEDVTKKVNDCNVALSALRAIFGKPLGLRVLTLSSDDDPLLTLSPAADGASEPDWLDADRFMRLAAQARARRDHDLAKAARALYTGPYLPDHVEDWVLARRDRLQQTYLDLLLDLAALCDELGDATTAESCLRDVLAVDPSHEVAGRALMLRCLDAGEPNEGIKIYHRLRAAMQRDLDLVPDVHTRTLLAQLKRAAAAPVVPPPSTVPPQLGNLPAALDRFIGRDRERQELADLLLGARLVTLTGTGGVGKTRLALEVARALGATYAHGVWFASLATLDAGRQPDAVAERIAASLRLPVSPNHPALEAIIQLLRDRQLLLLLDNCEHLGAACAYVVEEMLRGCPSLAILATSREPLRAAGESEYRVGCLPVPDPERQTWEQIREVESVRLFLERAPLRPGRPPSSREITIIGRLCRRLDGLALAIELAAAQAPRITGRRDLDDAWYPLRELTRGKRTALPRQQSLRATLAWSDALLTETQRAVFHRLGIFVGGCSTEAANAVCATDATADVHDHPIIISDKDEVQPTAVGVVPAIRPQSEAHHIDDLLWDLYEKSLVVADGTRFHLLEPVRAYALDRLEAAGALAEARDRHLAWYRDLALAAKAPLGGPDQHTWMALLDEEHDNIRAALRWSLHDPERSISGEDIVGSIWRFWRARGLMREGMDWFDRLVAAGGDQISLVRARACNAAAGLALLQGEFARAETYSRAALAVNEALPDEWGITASLLNLAIALREQGDYTQAAQIYERALPDLEASGQPINVASVLDALGSLARYQGDRSTARERYESALRLYRQVGHQVGIANSHINLGEHAYIMGDYREARRRLEQALHIFAELHDITGPATALADLAAVWIALDDDDAAARHNAEARSLAEQHGLKQVLALADRNDGVLALRAGDSNRASSLLRSALRHYRASREIATICDVLIALAGVALRQHRPSQAATTMQAVLAHSAAGKVALMEPTRCAIGAYQTAIANLLSTAHLRAAQQIGTQIPFDELVPRIMENQAFPPHAAAAHPAPAEPR